MKSFQIGKIDPSRIIVTGTAWGFIIKFIKADLLVLQLASSLVAVATVELEPEQWAMVVLGLFLVGIQATSTKRVSESFGMGLQSNSTKNNHSVYFSESLK